MGGSKKQTVGYKYYLGMHMVLTHGADKLLKIRFDNKTAWEGSSTGGNIAISRESLFGGESREGGVSGLLQFERGLPSQGQNSYLAARLGGLVPNFRGVAAVVLNKMYLGMNPYLKRPAFRLQRIHTRQGGVEQWYDLKAEIGLGALIDPTALWEWQQSVSDITTPPGDPESFPVPVSGWQPAAAAPFGNNFTGFAYNPPIANLWTPRKAFWIRKTVAIAASFSNLTVFTNAENCAFVYWDGIFIGAQNPTNMQGGDGSISLPVPSELATVGLHTIAIYALDEAGMGLSSDTYIYATLTEDTGTEDMNPAHIIRECLTDQDWGMGYLDADIDDAAFMDAADTLFTEGMGISLLWDRQMAIEDFVKEVLKHIDGVCYVDRKTGLWTLKLIRDDYNESDLLLLDENSIDKIEGFSRSQFGELVTSITVGYWDSATNTKAGVTIQDIALEQMQGAAINTTIQYPGFTNSNIAQRVAARDLRTLSTMLATCTIYADRTAKDLSIGQPFKATWPDYDLEEVVFRVTGIAYGDGKNNRIRIQCTEDAFGTPEAVLTAAPNPEWENPVGVPTPPPYLLAFEVPYAEMIQVLGQSTVDSSLAVKFDLGHVGAAAAAPTVGINGRLYTDIGNGFEDVGGLDFCPVALLDEDIHQAQVTFDIKDGANLDQVELGTWCQIDDEICKVIALSTGSITVDRGCLDTTPSFHDEDAVIFFWDQFSSSDPVEYVESDEVDVKVTSTTGAGETELGSVPTDSVTVVGRPARPYAPGKLRIDGDLYPTDVEFEFDVSWAHRDRVIQSDQLVGTEEADIGPEPGVTYTVRLYVEDVLEFEDTGITDNFLNGIEANANGAARLEVWSVRDSIMSYQPLWAEFEYIGAVTLTGNYPNWPINVPGYSYTPVTSGGIPPFTYSLESGTLPTGLLLNTSTGEISGTPTANDGTSFTVRVTDANSDFSDLVDSITIEQDASWANVELLCSFDGSNGATAFTSEDSAARTATFSNGAQLTTTDPKFGSACALFDGTNDLITFVDSADFTLGSGDFTIECWVRANAVGSTFRPILGHWNPSAQRAWILYLTGGSAGQGPAFFYSPNGNTPTSNSTGTFALAINTWYHVAVCRNGANLRLFVDGVQIGSTHNIGTTSIHNSTDTLKIAQGSTGEFLNGRVDELRITVGVARYTANFTPPITPFPRG